MRLLEFVTDPNGKLSADRLESVGMFLVLAACLIADTIWHKALSEALAATLGGLFVLHAGNNRWAERAEKRDGRLADPAPAKEG